MTSAVEEEIYLRYKHIEKLLEDGLPPRGHSGVLISPLGSLTRVLKDSPNKIVALSVGGGAGFSKEGVFDRPFITARMVGPQNDFDAAESLAMAVDFILTSVDSSQYVGQAYTLYITRTGGRPSLLEQDSADRYHFSGSYVAESASGR